MSNWQSWNLSWRLSQTCPLICPSSKNGHNFCAEYLSSVIPRTESITHFARWKYDYRILRPSHLRLLLSIVGPDPVGFVSGVKKAPFVLNNLITSVPSTIIKVLTVSSTFWVRSCNLQNYHPSLQCSFNAKSSSWISKTVLSHTKSVNAEAS